MKLIYGQKIRHKTSGKVVEFQGVFSQHRGKIKIQTSDLDFGPIYLDQFEEVEVEEVVEVEKVVEEEVSLKWTLATKPEAYLKRFGDNGPQSKLAKEILGV